MKKKILKAVKTYLSIAYPDGELPQNVRSVLQTLENSENIFKERVFENPSEGIYSLRLGNMFYPHMKLVVKIEENDLLFDVDTHDSPERIPPTLPGYDRFKRIIKFNAEVKEKILNAFYGNGNTANCKCSKKFTVVFLDDEKVILDIFEKYAKCMGIDPFTYTDADRLLRDIESRKINPDICFVDVMMPEISGYDFVSKLKERNLKKFPVVFTTGVNPSRLKKDLCDDYLLKPVSLKEIESKLKKFKLL